MGKKSALLFGEECGSAAVWMIVVLCLKSIVYYTGVAAYIPHGFIFAFPLLIQVTFNCNFVVVVVVFEMIVMLNYYYYLLCCCRCRRCCRCCLRSVTREVFPILNIPFSDPACQNNPSDARYAPPPLLLALALATSSCDGLNPLAADRVAGRLSPTKLLMVIPAHFLGCVVGVVIFSTLLPFIPPQVQHQ